MIEPKERGWLWGCDPDVPIDRVVIDIVRGVAKEASIAADDPDLSDFWDRVEPEIRDIIERGQIVVCDNGA